MEEQSNKITYESLWKAIIRPPRDYYSEEELGPTNFQLHGRNYIRKDFDLIDFHGLIIKVSIIEPDIMSRPFDIMPFVIYVHANSSSRVEGINIKNGLLKRNINICSFDFEGSGHSEGEYISLGFHEKHQLKNVVDFLENYPGVGEIGLWGRSMGAATSLIYASMDKRIKAIVVDSPFADFRRVAKEMCMAQVSFPGFLIEGAISIIGKSVYKKNKMKINEIKPIEAVKKCDIPVIFVHAKDDDMVNFQHTLDLYNNYRGISKEIKETNGGHNAKRPSVIMEYIAKFFAKYLKEQNYDENYSSKTAINENEEIDNINMMNININDSIPQKKNKTIYEEWGILNPSSKNEKPKEEMNKKKENNNVIIINNEDKKENEKEEKIIGEKFNEINLSNKGEKEKLKEKNNINTISNHKDKEKIIINEKNQNKQIEINSNNKNNEIKNEIVSNKKENGDISDKKKENVQNEKNLNQKNDDDLKLNQGFTFYNTNKNFNSFIQEYNNDINKNKDIKEEDNLTNTGQNNFTNNNQYMPKRKTIYDDLNIRSSKK